MNKPIAPMVFNGTCNTELFEAWVEQFLIKELDFFGNYQLSRKSGKKLLKLGARDEI
jgi:hypothetical protein